MEITKYISLNSGSIIALVGNPEISDNQGYKILPTRGPLKTEDYFLGFGKKEKLLKALQVSELNENILAKSFNNLSLCELNKLAIVEALLTKESILILKNINKGLSYRESENLKRVLKKLQEHGKTVVVITNDIEFLFNLTKHVVFVDKNNVVQEYNPINWFSRDIYNYVAKPPIIDFVEYCRNRNIKIEDVLETKELLKSIYRSVDK